MWKLHHEEEDMAAMNKRRRGLERVPMASDEEEGVGEVRWRFRSPFCKAALLVRMRFRLELWADAWWGAILLL